ncbi:hypothetical protein LINPERPRIM_LOCUS41065 [Linum perenne]
MATVWLSSLKGSLHCKAEPLDVHDPKSRKQLNSILTRKVGGGRSGCSRNIFEMLIWMPRRLNHARILRNKSRSNLYREFVEKCNSSEEAIENIPPMMDKEDWKWLVNEVFLGNEFQRKSKIGKTIQKRKKLEHVLGSRPIVEKIYNHIEEHGEEPSYDTILVFSYKKGDTMKDAYAAEKIVNV